jgi:hypothetical protein
MLPGARGKQGRAQESTSGNVCTCQHRTPYIGSPTRLCKRVGGGGYSCHCLGGERVLLRVSQREMSLRLWTEYQLNYSNTIIIIIISSSSSSGGPPLWSSDQSSRLQIQRSRVRFPALPDFPGSSGSGTGSIQPRKDNWGGTWMEKLRIRSRKPRITAAGIRCADHVISIGKSWH